MPGTGGQRVTVEGRVLTLTNLDKVLYPETGTTKGEVLAYYAQVADPLLAWVRMRPMTRKRWPNGVGTAAEPGMVFFEKQLPRGAPEWVVNRPIEHHERTTDYPLCNDVATLTWLSQLAVLELHVPQWRFDPDGNPQPPDRLVLDLDPGPGVTLDDCAAVALRGQEEGIDMAARVHNALRVISPLVGHPGIEIRLHSTTLHASLYMNDHEMLANQHIFGTPASQAPIVHVRKRPDDSLFDRYARSFAAVWGLARPYLRSEADRGQD